MWSVAPESIIQKMVCEVAMLSVWVVEMEKPNELPKEELGKKAGLE